MKPIDSFMKLLRNGWEIKTTKACCSSDPSDLYIPCPPTEIKEYEDFILLTWQGLAVDVPKYVDRLEIKNISPDSKEVEIIFKTKFDTYSWEFSLRRREDD